MELKFSVPHFIMVGWLAAGFILLWIAQRRRHSTRKIVQNILLPMALGLVVFVTYLNVGFNYDFLIDDIDIVEMNPDVRDADGWIKLWGNDYWSGRSTDDNLYRPVVILSYWINARLPKTSSLDRNGNAIQMYPRYFRGVNLILLALVAWLIALWLMTWVQPAAAWIAAFLFAVHPSHAVVVNYIVGRADLLAVLGIAWFLYLQRRSIMMGQWSWWRKAAALIAVVIAIGSKETGLILVPAAMVQAWIGNRDASTDITDKIKTTPKPTYLWTFIILFVPVLLYFVGRFNAVGLGVNYVGGYMDDIRDNPLRAVSWIERIPAAFAIAWFYLGQIITPNTSYYQIPSELPGWTSFDAIAGLFLLVFCLLVFVFALKKRHWMAPVLTLALGQYLLVGNLVLPIGVYAANRLVLPFTLAAALASGAVIHHFCQKSTRKRAVAMLPAIAASIAMVIAIQDVTHHWATVSRLTGRDYQRAPDNPVAMYNYGTTRAREATYLIAYLDILDDASDIFKTIEVGPGHGRQHTRLQEQLSVLMIRIDRLCRHNSQWTAPPLPKAAIHERVEHTNELKVAIQLIRRSISSVNEVLVTSSDIDSMKKRLADNLDVNTARLNHHFKESLSLLEEVNERRPESLNIGLALGSAHLIKSDYHRRRAKDYELIQNREKAELEKTKSDTHRRKARIAYAEVVNRSKDESDIRVVEARIMYAKLCIDLSENRANAENSLQIAADTLAKKLLELESEENDHHASHIDLDRLKSLHKNALRYHGIIAWKNHQVQLAIKRHNKLLTLYPQFTAARKEHSQWIDLLGN